jgi:adenosylhomocysteine nucleosidase
MSQPVTVAFQAALPQEVQPFLRRIKARRRKGEDFPAWEFTWRAGRGVAVVSGMGEDAAARAAGWVFERYQPQSLVALGFGGSLSPELPAGALVLGESYWRYDPETRGLEELVPPPFPAWSAALAERLQAAGRLVFRGSLITTPEIIPKAGQGDLLTNLNHPVLEMETSAAALAARGRNVPFLALRAITDAAGEEIPDFLAQAVRERQTPTLAQALAWLAADPRRALILYRLWRRSRLAALHLAQALEAVLEVAGKGQ